MIMKEELVSIIIATFNVETTIERALRSVAQQTYHNIEIIIVDGLSSDNTMDIVRSFKHSNIKFLSEKDTGIYDALNKGVKIASGEWVYVLGADDELMEDGIASLLKHSTGYDCVYGDVIIRNNEGKKLVFKSKPAKYLPYAMCASHQAVLMKREIILKLKGFNVDYKISADYDLLLRAYLCGYKLCQTHVKVAYFACDNGVSSKLNWYVVWEQYRIYKNNKANMFPSLIVFWNFTKRLARSIIDTKMVVK